MCENCGSQETITITLTVEDTLAEFTTCSRCEARWWKQEGSPVALTQVLAAVGRK